MPESPQVFKSGLAWAYFKPTPKGLVFTRPSVWVFGRGQEYRVSDAQAGQLVARINRAYVVLLIMMTGVIVLAGTVVHTMMPRIWVEHRIAAVSAIAVFTVLLIGLLNAMVYGAAGSVLAGVSGTSAPREPYDPVSSLKKSTYSLPLTILTAFPTWLLVIIVISGLIAATASVMNMYKSGQVTFDIPVMISWVLFGFFVAALVIKLRARRSAK